MARDGIFDLVTPQDLFQKLQHDYHRLIATPGDQYAAIDFFISAKHLSDWVASSEKRQVVRCTLLEVCNELANVSKHRRSQIRGPKRRGSRRVGARDSLVGDTKVVGGAFQFPGFDPGSFDVGHLVIELAGDAEAEFGHEIEIEVLASKALEFWRNELAYQSL